MAEPRFPDPVLLVVAGFSRHAEAIVWAREHLKGLFGAVGLVSPAFAFNQTTYYEPMMGPGLQKQFFVFRKLVPADCLPETKVRTNELEAELAHSGTYAEPRPLNLDPGVLSLGKFLLATTKDQSHRIYLRDGIFAEVTLRYQAGAFEPWPWTYADYREPGIRAFLQEARDFYRLRLLEDKSPRKEDPHGKA